MCRHSLLQPLAGAPRLLPTSTPCEAPGSSNKADAGCPLPTGAPAHGRRGTDRPRTPVTINNPPVARPRLIVWIRWLAPPARVPDEKSNDKR